MEPIDREQTDSCQRGGRLWGWVKKVKGLRKNNSDRQQHGDYQRGRRWREVEEAQGEIHGDGKRLDLGW